MYILFANAPFAILPVEPFGIRLILYISQVPHNDPYKKRNIEGQT